MPYCSKCGVEVDDDVKECPLCSLPIQQFPDETVEKPSKRKYPDRTDQQVNGKLYPDKEIEHPSRRKLTPKEKRFKAWEVITASMLTPFLIVTFTDLIINATISWARFPMIALMLAWMLCTFPLLFTKRPVIMIVGIAVALISFLVLVDYFDNWMFDWIHTLALPIIALVLVLSVAVVVPSIKVKNKGMNIAAFILFAVGILNLGLDLIIMSTIQGKVTVTWSLFVLVPTFIVGGFLMYMHYRFTKDTDFKTKIKAKFQT
ncbi:MAG: zinc ribbon domain-containing protein [Candidatus Heimdallarchaeota archaeon]|nr:zinc ribbon domain-containing protein [Candidatus Heimdallarchaeota archaeon]